MQMNDTPFWVGFSLISKMGRVKQTQLKKFFGSLEAAWKASAADLSKAGLESDIIEVFLAQRPQISLPDEMDKLARNGVTPVTFEDKLYPPRLKEIYDNPPLLYVKGTLLPKDEMGVAVVGTRQCTLYGKQVTEEITTDLARSGLTIISGLARGIDSVAHRAALKAGGRSLAVLGSGLDIIYPAENASLARQVSENGALISEYPLGTRPKPEYFPRRNRILSGLSLGVLVVEAGEKSGALITAGLALEQNREVFAIPGSLFSPASTGTNHLIQEGAKLVRAYTDIMEELNLMSLVAPAPAAEKMDASDIEQRILSQLNNEPIHVDEICRRSGLGAATVASTLALMEMKEWVKPVSSMNYVLSRIFKETGQKTGIKK
jgi:DNA processing protein